MAWLQEHTALLFQVYETVPLVVYDSLEVMLELNSCQDQS